MGRVPDDRSRASQQLRIGKTSGLRLEALAALLVNPCGDASAPRGPTDPRRTRAARRKELLKPPPAVGSYLLRAPVDWPSPAFLPVPALHFERDSASRGADGTAFDHHRERTTTMASTTAIYPTTIFPTIGRRNAVLMFLMALGLLLAIGWFIKGISIEPASAIEQQVRYLSYVISATGWVIFTLSLFLGIMVSQLDVIAHELRQLGSVSTEPAPSQPTQTP